MSTFSSYRPLVLLTLGVAGLVLTVGCGGGGETDSAVQIEQGTRSPALPGAKARIASPAEGAVRTASDSTIAVEADSFDTGIQTDTERAQALANSANGQHVHVILDNQPYMANYEPGMSFTVGAMEPGAHTLVAFPSRSYHESVKASDAYDVVNFYVGEETGSFMLNEDDPALIYSRPKGSYSGAGAERIMMDFYLHNVTLSADGYKARYTIRDGAGTEVASATLTEWAPAFVTGLSSGTYEVTLQLLDEEGNVVPGSFNDTTREIRVETASGQSS
jgi:hypothetical protein